MIYRRNLFINYASRCFSNLAFTMPVWIAYYRGFITAGELSLLIAAEFSLRIILEIPSGAVADLLGRKWTVAIGHIFGAIGTFAILLMTDFWGLLLLRPFHAIADAFISGADEALVYDSMKQDGVEGNYRAIYSKGMIFAQIALVVGALTGGHLYVVNHSLPFIALSVATFIAFVLTLFYIEPKIDSEKFSWSGYKKHFVQGIKEAFKTPLSKSISYYFIAVGGLTWSMQMYFNTSFLTDVISSDWLRGTIQAAIRLTNVVLLYTVFGKSNKMTVWHKLLFFPVVMLLVYLPGVFVHSPLGAFLVYGSTLAATMRWVFMSEITNKFYDSKYRATAISTMSMFINLVTLAMLLVSSVIIPRFGTGAMFTFAGLMTLAVVVPLLRKVKSGVLEMIDK